MFKFPIPVDDVCVYEYAYKHGIKNATARYHLEKMVKAGVVTKYLDLFEEEAEFYNPLRTHTFVTRAVYSPVEMA
jgi:hypothetical protein